MSDEYTAKQVRPRIFPFDDVPFPIKFVYPDIIISLEEIYKILPDKGDENRMELTI